MPTVTLLLKKCWDLLQNLNVKHQVHLTESQKNLLTRLLMTMQKYLKFKQTSNNLVLN